MVALQIYPEFGAIAKEFAESNSHFGRDRLSLIQYVVKCLPRDSEGGHYCRLAHAYRRKNFLSENFTRMRGDYGGMPHDH